MAKTKAPTPSQPTLPPEQGLRLLKEHYEEAQIMLAKTSLEATEVESWCHATEMTIKDTFGQEHENNSFFWRQGPPETVISSDPFGSEYHYSDEEKQADLHEKVRLRNIALATIIRQLEARLQLSTPGTSQQLTKPTGKDVFIVHGHESGVKEATARLVENLGLKAVILHEQANRGRTLIEKFESHAAEAGFAVVLLTGDDFGRTKDEDPSASRPRARQNVILELGFFIGQLGREKVCALYEQGVELPSDLNGVTYVLIDPRGKWKHDLAYEIRAAGFDISLDSIR